MTNELHLPTFKLLRGAHSDRSSGACFMEAVAWWAGEKHTDRPKCVDPMIAGYGIRLNDRFNDAERELLVPLIPFAAGTATTDQSIIDERLAILRKGAVACARIALPIYEAAHPGDLRVRECVEATEAYLVDLSEENLATLRTKRTAAADAAVATATVATAAATVATAAAAAATAYAAYASAYAAAAADAAADADATDLRPQIVDICVNTLKEMCLVGLSVDQIANLPTLIFEQTAPEQFPMPGEKALSLIRVASICAVVGA